MTQAERAHGPPRIAPIQGQLQCSVREDYTFPNLQMLAYQEGQTGERLEAERRPGLLNGVDHSSAALSNRPSLSANSLLSELVLVITSKNLALLEVLLFKTLHSHVLCLYFG